MSKVIGFLLDSASVIPFDKIYKSSLKHRVYIIDNSDKKLC
jgi:hypothetical protein